MTQSIPETIARAHQAASELVARLPVSQPRGRLLQAPSMPAAPLVLDDMLTGSIQVDHWLKFTEYGIAVGDRTRPLDAISAYLTMDEIAYCYQVKYQFNGAAKYHRSYDRMTDARGGPWSLTLEQAKQIDASAYEYRSAEIPLISAEDILGTAHQTVAVREGETLGMALPTTGWKPFQKFVRDLGRRRIDARAASLKLNLGFAIMQKAGVKDWSVPQFTNAEQVDHIPLFDIYN